MPHNRRRTRSAQKGFTLMELMVVIAIIALIATFSVPKLTRSVDRTKSVDAINAAYSIASQVLATCATKTLATALNSTVVRQSYESRPPNGYQNVTVSGGATCSRYSVIYPPEVGNNVLPTITACYNSVATGANAGVVLRMTPNPAPGSIVAEELPGDITTAACP